MNITKITTTSLICVSACFLTAMVASLPARTIYVNKEVLVHDNSITIHSSFSTRFELITVKGTPITILYLDRLTGEIYKVDKSGTWVLQVVTSEYYNNE